MTGRCKAADVPGVNLRWNQTDRRLFGIKGPSVNHIGFEVANFEGWCKRLEAEGVNIELTEGLAALDSKAEAKAP